MTKTIFKTLLSLLILFSISCGDRPTGSDGGGIIGDNKETPQTETQASKDFLDNFNLLAPQYTGKIEDTREYESSSSYSFDGNADMTVTSIDYETGQSKTENYTFWGMAPDNKEYAYYYKDYAPYTFPLKYYNGDLIEITEEAEIDKVGSAIFDYSSGVQPTLKTPDDTSGDGAWKNNVKDKKNLTAKNKYTTIYNYTFESGGNIKETTGSGQYAETKTYYFWGALDNNRVVYYKKYNPRDYFGEDYKGEDKEFWEYCGFSFDKNNLTEFKKYELSDAYRKSYYNWSQSQNENNINWSSLPLSKRSDIDWSKPITGKLTTK